MSISSVSKPPVHNVAPTPKPAPPKIAQNAIKDADGDNDGTKQVKAPPAPALSVGSRINIVA